MGTLKYLHGGVVKTIEFRDSSESPLKIMDGGIVKGIPLSNTGPLKIMVGGVVRRVGGVRMTSFQFVRSLDYDNDKICVLCADALGNKYFYTYDIANDVWVDSAILTTIINGTEGYICLNGNLFVFFPPYTIKKYSYPELILLQDTVISGDGFYWIDENRLKIFISLVLAPNTLNVTRIDENLNIEAYKQLSSTGIFVGAAANQSYFYFCFFSGGYRLGRTDLDFNNFVTYGLPVPAYSQGEAENGRVFLLKFPGETEELMSFNQIGGDFKNLGRRRSQPYNHILSVGLTKNYISFIQYGGLKIKVYDWTHTFVKYIDLP